MDYMFLIYHDRLGYEIVSQDAIDACMKVMYQIQADATEKGILKAAAGLGTPNTAKSVHVKDGQVSVTDGPFAETKEALGGYYIITCKDDDEAQYWATRIGQASGNAIIEFRQIGHGGRSKSDDAAAASKR